MLRFGVYNEEGKMLGQRILPFNDLQVSTKSITICGWEVVTCVPGIPVNTKTVTLCKKRDFMNKTEKKSKLS